MRRPCSIHLAVFFAALLSADAAHAQFPATLFGPVNVGGNEATRPVRNSWDMSDRYVLEVGATPRRTASNGRHHRHEVLR